MRTGRHGELVSFVIPYRHMERVVLDTNVLVSAIRSRLGASYKVLSLVGTDVFDVAISIPLIFEYEDVLMRHAEEAGLAEEDVRAIVDYICSVGVRQEIFFLWRPYLRDPGDDMVLELAIAADCNFVVTHNGRDFRGSERFGVFPVPPAVFLNDVRGHQ